MDKLRVIISGGGTGGHIFPAISIANAIKREREDCEILFVGASGKMEMERVPKAGYKIIGIPARGLKRPLYSLSNIKVAIDYLKCKNRAEKIIKEFRPDIVVGVGGYASAAVVGAASKLKIPIILQEQNSYAGLVNKKNGSKAEKICVAYDNMERFFPKDKIVKTGNPIREEISAQNKNLREEGLKYYNLDPSKPCVFIVGGSLGCKTLNESVKKMIEEKRVEEFQLIWQCGKIYKEEIDKFMDSHSNKNIYYTDFVSRMDLAYAVADVVVSRAGAGTISELCAVEKATIFVPSPNVAEDHQTHNAMALVGKNAAEIVRDSEAKEKLIEKIEYLLHSRERIKELESNIGKLALCNASKDIAKICLDAAQKGIKISDNNHANSSEKFYKYVYFIGIGGIGMSAIARYYKHRGSIVSGYDKTETALTRELVKEGIDVHYEDDISKIPQDKENTLVIYTPAIPADMQELMEVNNKQYNVVKRSKALGVIAEGQKCLAVSGSHGKTTTSTLLAHIYTNSGVGCSAFLGGISKNYNSNLILSKNNNIVVEADEFDRSFLQLHPHIAIVTATDADHLDIYGTVENMREAFAQFTSQVDGDGYVVIKSGTKINCSETKAKILGYSITKDKEQDNIPSSFYASDIEPIIENGKSTGLSRFTLNYPKEIIGGEGKIYGCTLGVPGWVNIENAVAASAVALLDGIDTEKIKEALKTFSGVKRRMDIHLNNSKFVYIDDYAHHPQEIASTLSSIRESFEGRNITAIFQPHLYTRTRDLASEFAQSLSSADSVILLDIYPARELPIEGVTSEIIYNEIDCNKTLITKEELLEEIKRRKERDEIDLLVSFGAGNIDNYVEPISKLLSE